MPGTVKEVSATLVAKTMRRAFERLKSAPAQQATAAQTTAKSRCVPDGVCAKPPPPRESRVHRAKYQNIALTQPCQFVHRINNTIVQIALALALIRLNWPITNLNRIGASADIDDRRGLTVVREMLGKTFRINRCRGDDDFEIGTFGQNLAQIAEQKSMFKLRSCASSMMIVSYWRSSRSVCVSASKIPSVISDRRTLVQTIGETDFVADHFAQVCI